MTLLSRLFALRSIPFVRDIATMQLGRAAYLGFSLAANIVFARLLGPDAFGVYAVVLAFVATARALTSLGQATALQVFFAEAFGKRDRTAMAGVLKGFCTLTAANTAVLVLLACAAVPLTQWLYGDGSIGLYAAALFFFNIIDIGNGAAITVLQAVRRIPLKTAVEQGQNIAFLCLAMALLFWGYGLWGIFAAQIAVSIVMLCISSVLYARVARELSLPSSLGEIARAPRGHVGRYVRQSLLFSLDKNIGGLYPGGLFFVLSLVAQPYAVGLARIALQLASVPASFLLSQVNELSTTVLAAMSADRALVRRMAAKVIKHALAFHALLSVGALLALPVIMMLYGERYASALPIALWLIVLGLFSPLTVVNSPLLRLFRKVHYSLLCTVVTTAITWSGIYLLAGSVGPIKSFLGAYLIGQLLPLSLTAYLFLVVLRRPSRA